MKLEKLSSDCYRIEYNKKKFEIFFNEETDMWEAWNVTKEIESEVGQYDCVYEFVNIILNHEYYSTSLEL